MFFPLLTYFLYDKFWNTFFLKFFQFLKFFKFRRLPNLKNFQNLKNKEVVGSVAACRGRVGMAADSGPGARGLAF